MKKWKIRAAYNPTSRNNYPVEFIIEADTREKAIEKAREYMKNNYSKISIATEIWICYEI